MFRFYFCVSFPFIYLFILNPIPPMSKRPATPQKNTAILYNNLTLPPTYPLRPLSPSSPTYLPTNQLTPTIQNRFRNSLNVPVFSIVKGFPEVDSGVNAYTLAEYESFMRKEEQEEKREMMREVRGMVKRSCKEVQAGRLGKQQEAKRQHQEVAAIRVELGDIAHKVMNKQKTNTFVRRPETSSQHSITLIRKAKQSNPRTKAQKTQNLRQYIRQTGRKHIAATCKPTEDSTRSFSQLETSLDISVRLSDQAIEAPQKLTDIVQWPKTKEQVFEALRRNINRQCFNKEERLIAKRDAHIVSHSSKVKLSKHKRSGKFVRFSPTTKFDQEGQDNLKYSKSGVSIGTKRTDFEHSKKTMTKKDLHSFINSAKRMPVSIDLL